jgi:hypothetical protein
VASEDSARAPDGRPEQVRPEAQPQPGQPPAPITPAPQGWADLYPQPPAPTPAQTPSMPNVVYTQPAVSAHGWGTQPPLPPPKRPSLPRRTVAGAAGMLAVAIAATATAVAVASQSNTNAAQPSKGAAVQDANLRALWRTVPAADLLPAELKREGTETYVRLGLNADETCAKLPAPFTSALAPATCSRVIEATYVDRTQTVTATVGIVVLAGTTANRLGLYQSWTADANAAKTDMMPHTYAVPDTVAVNFADAQRITWQSQVSPDGTYLVYTVAGFTDGRTGPDAAARASGSGSALTADSPPVQVAGDIPAAIQNVLAAKQTATGGPA